MNCAGTMTTSNTSTKNQIVYWWHLIACNINDAIPATNGILAQQDKMNELLKPPKVEVEANSCFAGTNPANAPKLNISNWKEGQPEFYKNWGYLYEDWGVFVTVKESNGKYYHICRKVVDGWGDEQFMFVEAGQTNYQYFLPEGYNCPKDIYITYGNGLKVYGEIMEKSILIAATTFATGGISSIAGLGVFAEIGLNMGVETSKQMVNLYIEQGKDFSMQSVVDNLDLFDIAIESLPIVNKTIGVMGGKEAAILAKNYFKDVLTAVFDYTNKQKWEVAFKQKDASKAVGELLTDRLAGELIGKYSTIWEKSFTDAGIKQDLAIQIIKEFSVKTKEYTAEILNYVMVQYFNRSDLGEFINDNLMTNRK